mmetsp:Transcript_26895/g.63012  ORF Transcript_26895/g.63012 Transcript_26895/m.63012 type:complete len:1014 (-) Transcript_26895:3-3044(-)
MSRAYPPVSSSPNLPRKSASFAARDDGDEPAADDDDVRSGVSIRSYASARSGVSSRAPMGSRSAHAHAIAATGHNVAASEVSLSGSQNSPFRLVSPSSGTLLEGVHKAAFLGDSELLSRCLHEEPDCVTRASPDGWLPLHYAAEHGHTVCAEMLLASEANVDARGRDGWTALMWAGRRGHEGMVDLLLDAGADTSLAHVKGWTALHLAAACGHTKICRRLVSAGANVFAVTQKRATALHLSVSQRRVSVTRLLLQLLAATYGADPADFVERRDVTGSSAAHVAAQADCPVGIFELLLEHGSRRDSLDANGRAPLAVYERRERLAAAAASSSFAPATRAKNRDAAERNRIRSLLSQRRAGADDDAAGVDMLHLHFRGMATNEMVLALKELASAPPPPDHMTPNLPARERSRAQAAAAAANARARHAKLLLGVLLPDEWGPVAAFELVKTGQLPPKDALSPGVDRDGFKTPMQSPTFGISRSRSNTPAYVPFDPSGGSPGDISTNASAMRAGEILAALGGRGNGDNNGPGLGLVDLSKSSEPILGDGDDEDSAVFSALAAATAAVARANGSLAPPGIAHGLSDDSELAYPKSPANQRFVDAPQSPLYSYGQRGGAPTRSPRSGYMGALPDATGSEEDDGEEVLFKKRRQRVGPNILAALLCAALLLATALIVLSMDRCKLTGSLASFRPARCEYYGAPGTPSGGGAKSLSSEPSTFVSDEVNLGLARALKYNCSEPSEGDVWLSEYPRGTLYMFQNGRWGTVCVHGFDRYQTFQAIYPAAGIVCKQLGFNSRSASYVGARRSGAFEESMGAGDAPALSLSLEDYAERDKRKVPMNSQWAHCAGAEPHLARCGTDRWVSASFSVAEAAAKCDGHGDDVIMQCAGSMGGRLYYEQPPAAGSSERHLPRELLFGSAENVKVCGSRDHQQTHRPKYDTREHWLGAALPVEPASPEPAPASPPPYKPPLVRGLKEGGINLGMLLGGVALLLLAVLVALVRCRRRAKVEPGTRVLRGGELL